MRAINFQNYTLQKTERELGSGLWTYQSTGPGDEPTEIPSRLPASLPQTVTHTSP